MPSAASVCTLRLQRVPVQPFESIAGESILLKHLSHRTMGNGDQTNKTTPKTRSKFAEHDVGVYKRVSTPLLAAPSAMLPNRF